ncbi:uncharacterized protein TNCV_699181 [Trichonephila clavipes]|nr:uncharacterized protein TNCV_699181 [Trichonephila clavipes]
MQIGRFNKTVPVCKAKKTRVVQGYLSTTEKMPCRRIRAHYEQLSEFERGRIITLEEAGWANRRIACHMGRRDADIRRCLQEWADNGSFQCHDGRG